MTNPDSGAEREAGSFRDPAGTIYHLNGRVFRTVNAVAAEDFTFSAEHKTVKQLESDGRLVASQLVDDPALRSKFPECEFLIEHERIPYISYPYEWSFQLLKRAAIAHLDIQMELLEVGLNLSDATAYNMQWNKGKPVFIDRLSIRKYRDGEYWEGHRQFCEQFLNPLLLRSLFGISHNSWYRGEMEGIRAVDLAPLLSWRHKLSYRTFAHVVLQAKFQKQGIGMKKEKLSDLKRKSFSKNAFLFMLRSLRKWIAKLEPSDQGYSVWGDYAENTTYNDEETNKKRAFVAEFCSQVKPDVLWDMGCNTGDYSELALQNGAKSVVGFDFDDVALDRAFTRLSENGHDFLPLRLDAANPSPAQGWRQTERKGFDDRLNADAVIALAFEHHLAIGKNTGLEAAIDWLMSLAPKGIIEFVPKTDPTVQKMMALRDDIFVDYDEGSFVNLIEARGTITKTSHVSESGRFLCAYQR